MNADNFGWSKRGETTENEVISIYAFLPHDAQFYPYQVVVNCLLPHVSSKPLLKSATKFSARDKLFLPRYCTISAI